MPSLPPAVEPTVKPPYAAQVLLDLEGIGFGAPVGNFGDGEGGPDCGIVFSSSSTQFSSVQFSSVRGGLGERRPPSRNDGGSTTRRAPRRRRPAAGGRVCTCPCTTACTIAVREGLKGRRLLVHAGRPRQGEGVRRRGGGRSGRRLLAELCRTRAMTCSAANEWSHPHAKTVVLLMDPSVASGAFVDSTHGGRSRRAPRRRSHLLGVQGRRHDDDDDDDDVDDGLPGPESYGNSSVSCLAHPDSVEDSRPALQRAGARRPSQFRR
jgi:hypothetical protein